MSEAKNYKLKPEGMCVRIVWEGGGQVPQELSGLYTSNMEAIRYIELYEKNRKENKKTRTTKTSNDK